MTSTPTLCPVCSKATERKFQPFCSAECSNIDLDRVAGELRAGIEMLAVQLLGEPSIRKPWTWRWGSKGALVVEIAGRKRGAWHDKDSEQGGGPLHLIAHGRSCSMAEAIRWARDWTGGTPEAGHDYKAEQAQRQAERDRKARKHAAEDAEDAARRITLARRLWAEAVPIAGTVAERYLTEVRRIPAPEIKDNNVLFDSPWPDAVRFHPPSRSLIVAATLVDGTVQAVQRVRLMADAQKVEPTPDRPTKVTNGVLAGAAVRLPAMNKGAVRADICAGQSAQSEPIVAPLLLAEGPESGASVWASTGRETWIALGGMAGVALPAGRQIVACRDDDPKHSPGDKKMVRAVETWRAAGHKIAVATPWPFRAYDRSDFNDTLKLDGAEGVKRRIASALNPGGGAPTRLPIIEVRRQLRGAVGKFFDEVRDWTASKSGLPPEFTRDLDAPPMSEDDWGSFLDEPVPESPPPRTVPVRAIRTDVGSGKTVTAISEAIRLLAEMRAAGDKRAAAFAVPTHKLGDEQASIFALHARGTGLTAAVWRGMSAPDPDSPANPMCLNLEAIQDARDAMLDVYKTTCRRKLDNGDFAICLFFNQCGYERQRQTEADLWIVPHELLFGEKPTAIGKLAFLVVDESVWQDGLEGVHGKPTALPLDAVAHLDPLPNDAELAQGLNRQRLEYLRNRLLDVLRQSADGPVTAEALAGSDLSLDNTREAYRLEWARFVDPGMHPAMTRTQRRDAAIRAANNARIGRFGSMWQAMTALLEDGGPQRSGWVSLAMQQTDDGPVKVLHLKGRRLIRKGWLVPTLLIDATMNIDLVRPYWPDVELTAELLADAPHQRIRQVVDRAYSKSAIEHLTEDMPGYTPAEAKRRERGLRAVHAVLNREARQYEAALNGHWQHPGSPVLVVAQKAVKEALPSFGPMAACTDLAHHNNVAGRDIWRNVRGLIVVGRTQPAPASVERLAEALTGRAVDHLDGWYGRGDGVRHTAAEGAVTIEADRHPDPIAEAIRWQICEGELVQIIGRGRGVNRAEDNPLDVLVLTDSPLPIPVAATIQAADLAPSPADLMLAAGGIVFENAADAAAAYPQLWSTRNAANHALKRWRAEWVSNPEVGAIPLIESIIRGLAPTSSVLGRIAYQLAGAGKSPSVAWLDPLLVPDPIEWLTARLGALAWCHDGHDPDPPPSPSAPQNRAPHAPRPSDPPAEPVIPDWWDDAPPWSPSDMERAMAEPDGYDVDLFTPEHDDMPELPEQARLNPAAVYRRGHLVAPQSDLWTIRVPGQPPIEVRGLPGIKMDWPRSSLSWVWPLGSPVAGNIGTALIPDAQARPWIGLHEPGD